MKSRDSIENNKQRKLVVKSFQPLHRQLDSRHSLELFFVLLVLDNSLGIN